MHSCLQYVSLMHLLATADFVPGIICTDVILGCILSFIYLPSLDIIELPSVTHLQEISTFLVVTIITKNVLTVSFAFV